VEARRAMPGRLDSVMGSRFVELKTLLDREDFLEASFLLSVLGEGTFLDLLRFIQSRTPNFM